MQSILEADLVMNVIRDGRWGAFRHQLLTNGTQLSLTVLHQICICFSCSFVVCGQNMPLTLWSPGHSKDQKYFRNLEARKLEYCNKTNLKVQNKSYFPLECLIIFGGFSLCVFQIFKKRWPSTLTSTCWLEAICRLCAGFLHHSGTLPAATWPSASVVSATARSTLGT